MKLKAFNWFCALFSILAMCQLAPAKEFEIQDQPKEVLLPGKIWELLFGEDLQKARERAGALIFVPIDVRLIEKNSGVLVAPEVVIHLPKGGGEVDFAKYLTGAPGTFFVHFDFEDIAKVEKISVFFISQGRKRRLGGEVIGSGCSSIADLTQYYLKENSKEGFKVNTTEDRHVTVIGGHFIFSATKSKTNYVSMVTFLDGRAKHMMCDGFFGEAK